MDSISRMPSSCWRRDSRASRARTSAEGERPGLGADGLGEVGQGLGVDPVGLGQAAGGLGEVAGLAGVDRGDRDLGDLQRGDQGQLQAAGGLDDDQGRGQGSSRATRAAMPAGSLGSRSGFEPGRVAVSR